MKKKVCRERENIAPPHPRVSNGWPLTCSAALFPPRLCPSKTFGRGIGGEKRACLESYKPNLLSTHLLYSTLQPKTLSCWPSHGRESMSPLCRLFNVEHIHTLNTFTKRHLPSNFFTEKAFFHRKGEK